MVVLEATAAWLHIAFYEEQPRQMGARPCKLLPENIEDALVFSLLGHITSLEGKIGRHTSRRDIFSAELQTTKWAAIRSP